MYCFNCLFRPGGCMFCRPGMEAPAPQPPADATPCVQASPETRAVVAQLTRSLPRKPAGPPATGEGALNENGVPELGITGVCEKCSTEPCACVTGDGDEAVREIAEWWGAEIPLRRPTVDEIQLAERAYAAGLARGRALGARDAIELVRAAGQLGEMDMGYAEILIAAIARRAGRACFRKLRNQQKKAAGK